MTYVLTFAGAGLAFLPARAQAEVWVDDCAGTGTGTVGDPYCKIQTAICNIKHDRRHDPRAPRHLPRGDPRHREHHDHLDRRTGRRPHSTLPGSRAPRTTSAPIGVQPNCSAVYFRPPPARPAASRASTSRTRAGASTSPRSARRSARGSWSSVRLPRSRATRSSATSLEQRRSFELFYGGGIYINGTNPAAPPRPVITTNLIQGNIADPPNGTSSVSS